MNNQPSPFLTPAEMAYIEGTNEIDHVLGRSMDKDYSSENRTEETKMESIKQGAMAYEPQLTKNIADLKEVNVDMQLEDRTGKDREGTEFKYKVIVVDEEDYRVPGKVLGDLKSILEKKPTLKTFSVSKKGIGMNTQYTVIPLE